MQLAPRYDAPPVLRLEGFDRAGPCSPAVTMTAQRRRLGAVLDGLTDEQWAAPSRCSGWTVKDVVAHLNGTNPFWTISIKAGLNGQPTRFLEAFDPVATPAGMVEAVREQPPADVLAAFHETVEALAAVAGAIDGDAWDLPAEAPPGHLPLDAVVLHAHWDAFVHERDILLPLGLEPAADADGSFDALRYAAVIGPALLATTGSTRTGRFVVVATDLRRAVEIEVGSEVVVRPCEPTATLSEREADAVLTGDVTELVDALSERAPLPTDGIPLGSKWMFTGLGLAFDAEDAPVL